MLSHTDTFPLGQPFKSLYAVHALHDYLGPWQPRPTSPQLDDLSPETDACPSPRAASLIRTMSLVVMAISDPQVAAQCPNRELQIELGSALVELFVALLGGILQPQPRPFPFTFTDAACLDSELPAAAAEFLDAPLFDRLLVILSVAVSATSTENATNHVSLCLQSILESCSLSDDFMAAFCIHPEVPRLFEDLLLNDPQTAVRQNTAVLIRQKIGTEGERCGDSTCPPCSPGLSDTSVLVNSLQNATPAVQRFRDFFWPLIWRLVRPAITSIGNSVEILDLCFDMLQTLQEAQPETLDLEQLSDDWFSLLLDYTTSEVRLRTWRRRKH